MIKTTDNLVAEIMGFAADFHKIFFHLISVSIFFISILFERRAIVSRIVLLLRFGEEVHNKYISYCCFVSNVSNIQ